MKILIKQKTKIHAIFFFVAMLILVGSHVKAKEELSKEKISIYFFHNTACATCDGSKEFREVVEKQISAYQELCPFEIIENNVFKTGGKKAWDDIAEKYQLENESYIFPVMVLNGKMYMELPEICEQLHSAFLEAAGISALYFYRKDCQECLDMKSFWKELPEKFSLNRKEYPLNLLEFESRTGNNGELIRTLFERYEVPDDDQMVPFVFLKEGYLAGQKEIEENLVTLLEEGKGFLSMEK